MKPNSTILPLTVDFGETPVPFLKVLGGGIRIQGSEGAPRIEFKRMLDFAVAHNIRPQIMEFPMTKEGIEIAMKTLREGKMRYRGVLVAPQ
jgi:D-arabinose 1-dehydrogenase-like Zn-dependent alcohol dehydrogenase